MNQPANNHNPWILNVETHSRDQLIDISRVIANGLDAAFLQDPENIPHIQITSKGSTFGGGKCLIVEAMMKTLLDHHDPDDMKRPDAKREMFIEKEPAYATRHYCQAVGQTNGVPVIYGFDRVSGFMPPDRSPDGIERRLVAAFQKAAAEHGVPATGAIFAVSTIPCHYGRPWIVIEMCKGRAYSSLIGSPFGWERHLKISVLNERLTSSPHFRHYWTHLENFAKTDMGSGLKSTDLIPR